MGEWILILSQIGDLGVDGVFGLLDHAVHNVLNQIVDPIAKLRVDVLKDPPMGTRLEY